MPGWVEQLNRELPAGLVFRRAVVVGGQAPAAIDQMVQRFDYRVALPPPAWGGPPAAAVAAAVDAFLASASWPCLRRRAKGDLELDARPLVPDRRPRAREPILRTGDAPVLRFTLMRNDGGGILPVHDFLAALLRRRRCPSRGYCAVTRTGLLRPSPDGRWLSPVEEVGETGLRVWLGQHLND